MPFNSFQSNFSYTVLCMRLAQEQPQYENRGDVSLGLALLPFLIENVIALSKKLKENARK